MSLDTERAAPKGEGLPERLQRLRIKIDALPESQRPHLIDLADEIARQHRRLHTRVSQNHDAD